MKYAYFCQVQIIHGQSDNFLLFPHALHFSNVWVVRHDGASNYQRLEKFHQVTLHFQRLLFSASFFVFEKKKAYIYINYGKWKIGKEKEEKVVPINSLLFLRGLCLSLTLLFDELETLIYHPGTYTSFALPRSFHKLNFFVITNFSVLVLATYFQMS